MSIDISKRRLNSRDECHEVFHALDIKVASVFDFACCFDATDRTHKRSEIPPPSFTSVELPKRLSRIDPGARLDYHYWVDELPYVHFNVNESPETASLCMNIESAEPDGVLSKKSATLNQESLSMTSTSTSRHQDASRDGDLDFLPSPLPGWTRREQVGFYVSGSKNRNHMYATHRHIIHPCPI